MCVNQFVVNDAYFGNVHGKVKILTGPNASGKSVYLKQVGGEALFEAYLALTLHSVIHYPCTRYSFFLALS